MSFVYLDEFGHIGPYMARSAPKFNESPVFGLAGFILPETAVRPFATWFLQQKQHVFQNEIAKAGCHAAQWEKKGIEIFTAKLVARYPHFRSTGFRLINKIRSIGGHVFYYGREKIYGTVDVNPTGLYTTVIGHTIRQLDRYSAENNTDFVLIVDQHSAHKQLLIAASKTMYGHEPCRHMLSPPFEVVSSLNQNIQAADWIAAIVGRLLARKVLPNEYKDHQKFDLYFWQRLHQVSTHSTILPR